jgi:O-antigen ligase
VAALHRPFPQRVKRILIGCILIVGLLGFCWKFASYFQKGATSVGARLHYWSAAAQTALQRPWVGTGPGTFARAYAKIKPPEAEMAQLVHNDYLEQASDSGLLGFISYTLFWWGSILFLRRRALAQSAEFEFAVWLGLLGWCIQSFSEFGLYIPALAWTAFTLVGWLWAREIQ